MTADDIEVRTVHVFSAGPGGGNPVPMVLDARTLTPARMQAIAARHGHESAFVVQRGHADADFEFRFFVPNHEMEMCGHATVGTLWALRQTGEWTEDRARVRTRSGMVDAFWDEERGRIWISQPPASQAAIAQASLHQLSTTLGIETAAFRSAPVNACTSRVKTLVELASEAVLDGLEPRWQEVRATCVELGSTGLYPFARIGMVNGAERLCARQFPENSGYAEDAATGIAAAALWSHLADTGRIDAGTRQRPAITVVRQGVRMGRPSAIEVQARFDAAGNIAGCWLTGAVRAG